MEPIWIIVIAVIIALFFGMVWVARTFTSRYMAAEQERVEILEDLGVEGPIEVWGNIRDFSELWMAEQKSTGRLWYFPRGSRDPYEFTPENIRSVDIVEDKISVSHAVRAGVTEDDEDVIMIAHAGRSSPPPIGEAVGRVIEAISHRREPRTGDRVKEVFVIVAVEDGPQRLLDFCHHSHLGEGLSKDGKIWKPIEKSSREHHARFLAIMKQAHEEPVITGIDTSSYIQGPKVEEPEATEVEQGAVAEEAATAETSRAAPEAAQFQPAVAVVPRSGRPQTTETVSSQLTQLAALRQSGMLTEEEFQAQKARVLAG